ncbi:hypothetical protein EBR96_11265, partial [bacterium]|nr:hypothetical protein [bacterium]
ANGNVNISSAGNANVVVISGSGVNISGYLTATGNISGNVGSFSGNVTAPNFYANYTVQAVGNITGGNIISNSNVDTTNLNANYIYSNNTANIGGNLNANANVNIVSDLNANTANFSGIVGFTGSNVNVSNWLTVANTANVGNLRTDNLLYSNGQPWDLQQAAGSNTQIQYNDGSNNFGASANLTWDYTGNVLTVGGNANVTGTTKTYQEQLTSLLSTQIVYGNGSSFLVGSNNFIFNDSTNQFTVNGNAQFNNANLGNLATANFVDVASNLVANNANINLALSGNTANFSGNVSAANANLGNLATANFVSVSSNLVANNANINLALSGNTANFSGNLTSG